MGGLVPGVAEAFQLIEMVKRLCFWRDDTQQSPFEVAKERGLAGGTWWICR